jgi:hypothetical protein
MIEQKGYFCFVTPLGEPEYDLSDEVLDRLSQMGETFWQDRLGCGHGVLEFLELEKRVAWLEMSCKDGVGFYLHCKSKDPNKSQSYAINTAVKSLETVKLHFGGEPIFVPLQFFHSPERAAAAMKEFRRTADLPSDFEWFGLDKLNSWDDETGEWHGVEN